MEHSIVEIVRALRRAVEGEPSAHRLQQVRTTVDDPAFAREIADVLRMTNAEDAADELRHALIGLQRDCEQLATRLEGRLRRIGLIGIGGGAGLATGGILAAIAISAPPIAIIPFAGGVYMVFRYGRADRQLGEEIGIARQIADEIKAIRGRF